MGIQGPLWRAIAVYRLATLIYAAVLVSLNHRHFAYPLGGWLVIGVMAGWTAFATYAYAAPQRRRWPLLTADVIVTAGCLLATRWVVAPAGLMLGTPTLPMAWVAAPVLACAAASGRRAGLAAAALIGACDLVVQGGLTQGTFNGTVLLLLAGGILGHLVRLAGDAEERLQRAVALETATRERERLARGIHDSVLQVLALVQRRGTELGGEAAELGRLAGEQEATLRSLVSTGSEPATAEGKTDLRALLRQFAAPEVSIAAPAGPVFLPARVAEELARGGGGGAGQRTPARRRWRACLGPRRRGAGRGDRDRAR